MSPVHWVASATILGAELGAWGGELSFLKVPMETDPNLT